MAVDVVAQDVLGDVTQVAEDVHDLVVAEQHDDLAALLRGLLLEVHQQTGDLGGAGAAVEEVAGLHQDRVAADPIVLLIDQPHLAQDLAHAVVGAVDVADGNDAPFPGGG